MSASDERTPVAALFVEGNGVYANRPGVDVWDESRDARNYRGPYPVVAHPPCARWSRFAGFVESRFGYRRGDDGGCFESALSSVRRFGGVLEHPAYSAAWKHYDLIAPPRHGGWVRGMFDPGWSCHVEQGRYGHVAKKATWLYAVGCNLKSLSWGYVADREQGAVNWANSRDRFRPRIAAKDTLRTPKEFCDLLIELARSVYDEVPQ